MPNGNGNIKAPFTWAGDINIEYPVDIDDAEPYRIVAETNFTLKMWVHPGMWNTQLDEPLIYNINLCNGEPAISGEITNNLLQGFYDVPMAMDMTEFCENASSGLILPPNIDTYPISGAVQGSYFQTVYGELSGEVYNPNDRNDLLVLIDNVDNPDLSLFTQGHGYAHPGQLSKPMQEVDFEPIWRSMLSGSLSGCYLEDNLED